MVLDNLSVPLHMLCCVPCTLVCVLFGYECAHMPAYMRSVLTYFSLCVCLCVLRLQVPCGHMCLCDKCADLIRVSITDCPM